MTALACSAHRLSLATVLALAACTGRSGYDRWLAAGEPVPGEPVPTDPGAADGHTGDPGPGDPTSGDPGPGDPLSADPGPGDPGTLDWREISPAQWLLWQAEANRVVAQGTSGATTFALEGVSVGTAVDKWTGGVLGANGKIYGFPEGAAQVLEIDPTTSPPGVALVGPSFSTLILHKWGAGVLAPDGRIIAVPAQETRLLIIDTTQAPVVVSAYDPGGGILPGTGEWNNAVRAYDGMIYALPEASSSVLMIDPSTPSPGVSTWGTLAPGAPEDCTSDYYGTAALSPLNGKIYAVPSCRRHVLEVDPIGQTIVEIGPELLAGTLAKFWGVIVAPNGHLYGMPDAAPGFLDIDTSTATPTIAVRTTASASSDGGSWAPNGRIYTVPFAGGVLLEFNPGTNTATTLSPAIVAPAMGWFSGCALAPNGKIYGIPAEAAQVLVIDPHANGTLDLDFVLGGFVNYY